VADLMIPGTLFGVITRIGVDCLVAQLTAKGKLITDHENGTGRPRSLVTGRDTPVFDSIRPTQNQFKAASRVLPSFGKAYDRSISIGWDARSLYHATKGKSRPVPVMRTAMQAFMSMFWRRHAQYLHLCPITELPVCYSTTWRIRFCCVVVVL